MTEQIPRRLQTTKTESEEIQNQNKPVASKEIESVIRKTKEKKKTHIFPIRTSQAQMSSLVNTGRCLKEEYQSFTDYSKKQKGREHFLKTTTDQYL